MPKEWHSDASGHAEGRRALRPYEGGECGGCDVTEEADMRQVQGVL